MYRLSEYIIGIIGAAGIIISLLLLIAGPDPHGLIMT